MTDRQWWQAWEIYRTALELPDDQRHSYLASISGDPEVLEQVLLLFEEQEASPEPATPELEPGATIGRYRVIGKLRRGGMGQVYSAQDTELGRTVALKLLAPDLIPTRAAMEKLIREAKATSALNHPHIVTIHEVVRSQEHVAIAMELVEGEPLRSYCGKPQPVAQVIRWGRQIAQALAAAHSRDIVHRDIKPENIMVRRDGYAKVLDFGLARQLVPEGHSESGSASGVLGGTFHYMSPEQTRAERAAGASDVFSLGVVLFELVTGTHPFARGSPIDTAHAIAHDQPKSPRTLNAGIPPALNSLLLAMLAKNPSQRPSASEVGEKLAAIESAAASHSRRSGLLATAFIAACIVSAIALWLPWARTRLSKQPEMIQLTHQESEDRVTAEALSPDGKYLAFAPFAGSIQLRRMSDGFTKSLNTPEGFEAHRIAWFGDGSRLLVSGSASDHSGIWVVPVGSGETRLSVPDAKDGVPSPDGTRIAFASLDGSNIWVSGVNGRNARQLIAAEKTILFSSLIWSPDGKRVAYERHETDPALEQQFTAVGDRAGMDYDFSFESVDVSTARIVASAKGIVMNSACALRDGRVFYLRWFDRSSEMLNQIWELRTDPRSGKVLGPPRRLTRREDLMLQSISASRDGKQVSAILFIEHPNLYTADLIPGDPAPSLSNIRRLTFAEANEYPHCWTADNRAVIFESNRNGTYHLFRQTIGQSEPRVLVADNGDSILAQLSPDGKWVLYHWGHGDYDWSRSNADAKLMRVSVDGGAPQVLATAQKLDEFSCGLRPGSRCVLRSVENGQLVFYDLDPIRGRGRELARAAWGFPIEHDWDLSPDGLEVAIPNHDPDHPEIQIISLDGDRASMRRKEIFLSRRSGRLNGVVWSADGKGFFVAFRSDSGSTLEYADLQGRMWELLKSSVPWPIFAVPSHDGKRLAFPQYIAWSNVWLFQGL